MLPLTTANLEEEATLFIGAWACQGAVSVRFTGPMGVPAQSQPLPLR